LAEGFQRRILKCEKLKDDGRQVMSEAHIRLAKNIKEFYSRNAIVGCGFIFLSFKICQKNVLR